MPFTGTVPEHPAQFSRPIVDVLRLLIERAVIPHGEIVVDPYAGPGNRLGKVCDELGVPFVGLDIERWPSADERVRYGDAGSAIYYPPEPFAVVTSPPYFGNRISSDYVNGPTATTKVAGRRSYGISLGRPLDPANLARFARPTRSDKHRQRFYAELGAAARCWQRLAVVNVDLPMRDDTRAVLEGAGFTVYEEHEIETQRYGGGAGADKRAPFEVVMSAVRR